MCSCATPNSSLLFPHTTADSPPSLLQRHRLIPPPFFTSFHFSSIHKPLRFRATACLAEPNRLNLSWFSPPEEDDYGGWGVSAADTPPQHQRKKKGLHKVVIGCVGFSLAVVLAAVAYSSRKGFKFRCSSPLYFLPGVLSSGKTEKSEATVSEERSEHLLDPKETHVPVERALRSVAADDTQQEALEVLRSLKIIEEDIRANDLCTRREYARWLVRTNSLLERTPKHRIVPSVALAGSLSPAFDDMTVEDPDFQYIQALAEAGIISSKLHRSNVPDGQGSINFCPESFLSRQDLINWKAQVEYDFNPEIMEEISRTKVDYMDVKEINPDAAPELFMDMLAGDKSIIRKVFGQIKRLQPNKPATKAQAAVALTSGRMVEAISAELSRIQAENISRQAEMAEIRSELLEKGDIKRFWDEKLQEERARGFELEELYHATIRELGQETTALEEWCAEHLKERAAIDCQKQLLFNLKEEIDGMSEKLASKKSFYLAERSELQETLSDLQSKLESLLDRKSILEAEIEALRILRSWVEDEARTSQARAKVLEEVGRRWKWDDDQA